MDTRADSGSSSQANLSIKFYSSFIKFLNYFLKYWINPLCIDFNNHNFGGLKTHYHNDLLILQEFLLTEFSSENFAQCMFELFEIFDVKIIDNDPEFYKLSNIEVVFKFLKAFTNDNFKFKINNQERKFTFEQVSKFNTFKNKMLKVFNSNNIEHNDQFVNSDEIVEQTIIQNEDITNSTSFMNNLLKLLDVKLNDVKISIETENKKQIQSLFNELKNSINNAQNQIINQTQLANNSNTIMNNISLNSHFNYVKRRLTKKTRYLDRINQFNAHLENETVPQELYYLNFPNPLFWDDADYIKEHNRLIKDFQLNSMKFSINFMKERITNIDKELLNVKDQLKQDIVNIDQKFEEIQNSVNRNLEKEFRKTDEKLKRFLKNNITKEFSVRNIQNQQQLSNKDVNFNVHTNSHKATNNNKMYYHNNNKSKNSKINNNNLETYTKKLIDVSHVFHNNKYKTHKVQHNNNKFNNQNHSQYHSFKNNNNNNNMKLNFYKQRYIPESYAHAVHTSLHQNKNVHNNRQFNKQNIQNNSNNFNKNTYHNNNNIKQNFQNNNNHSIPHQKNTNETRHTNNDNKRVRFLENRNRFQLRN
jgi:CCR4-NOT transcription complex subunit 7/8